MTVEEGFFDAVVELARRFGFAVIHDFAYGETCFDGYKAPSFLAAKGAKDIGVEFTTLSKPYSMAGFRIGFAAGNCQMLEALATIKGYYDYGIFQPIQIAAIIAMRQCDDFIIRQNEKYQARRDVLCEGLRRIGWHVDVPKASMFVWTKFPLEHSSGKGSIEFALDLIENAYVAMAPGRAFGENGEYYMRIALVENEHRLRQAIRNIARYIQGKNVPGKRKKTAK
jgi:alanine-synthesizing transaminase